MTDKTREEFENWHDCLFDVSASTCVKNEYGYLGSTVQTRWQAWQAATVAQEARVREITESMQRWIDHHNARADVAEAQNKVLRDALGLLDRNKISDDIAPKALAEADKLAEKQERVR